MFSSVPETFHEALKPLIYFNWMVGMGAFRLPNQSSTIYNFMKLWNVFFIVVTWTTIYVTLNLIIGLEASDDTSPMALTMFKALIYTNAITLVATPFLIWLQRKGMQDCMQQMAILDNTFKAVLGAPNKYKQQYIYLICQNVVIWIIMSLVTICDGIFGKQIKLQLSQASYLTFICVTQTLHQPIATMLLLDVNFHTFAGYLKKKFRYLNDSLLRLAEKPTSTYFPDERLFVISQNAVKRISGNGLGNTRAGSSMNEKHYLLREIRKAYLELCKLFRKMNFVFGLQNLTSMGISFVMITGLLYTIYSVLLWKNSAVDKIKEVFPSVIWTAIYVFKIWMINHTCWSVSDEVDKTGEVLYELLNPRVDKELQEEMKEFGVQRLQNPVRFNACGFFILDYTFVQGVIGSVTTYLVILIQLSHVSEGPVSNTAFTRNGTEI